MSDYPEHDIQEDIASRRLLTEVYGSNVGELEMAALDVARRFFGGDAQLEVVRDYSVGHGPYPQGEFFAQVSVRCLS